MDGTISVYIWGALIRINGLLIKKESMKLRERDGSIGPKRSWREKQMGNMITFHHIMYEIIKNSFLNSEIFLSSTVGHLYVGTLGCRIPLATAKGQTSAPTHVGTARAVRAERVHGYVLCHIPPGFSRPHKSSHYKRIL